VETLVKGDVIVLPFPFSNLSASKNRPALVAAIASEDEVILCQITSVLRSDKYVITLSDGDFKQGGLHMESRIRCNKLFTADKSIISYKIGILKESKVKEVENKLVEIFMR